MTPKPPTLFYVNCDFWFSFTVAVIDYIFLRLNGITMRAMICSKYLRLHSCGREGSCCWFSESHSPPPLINRLVWDPESGRPAPILPRCRQQEASGTSGGPVMAPDLRGNESEQDRVREMIIMVMMMMMMMGEDVPTVYAVKESIPVVDLIRF